MKTLYLECHMGAAGDMLMGALLELLPDSDAFLETINSIGLPGVEIQAEPSVKCGITGTHISVKIHGEEEHSEDHHHSDDVHVHAHSHQDTPIHSHSHTHKHHHHCHRGMAEIMEILEHLNVTEEVKKAVEECNDLAPLHNPANLIGVEACEKLMPNTPMVAVFDTAFHQTMPPKAYMYGLPYEYYEKYKVRRYGFHGTSHSFVSKRAAELLGKPYEETKTIVCHLGNGSSVTAVMNGKSVDTSMGLTPLEGLVMGTRCGDIDPAIMEFLAHKLDLDVDGVMKILNKDSGVYGLSGGLSSDFRDLTDASLAGDKKAQVAMEVFSYRVAKYIGAYVAAMNGVDDIVFTAGIGENDDIVRRQTCSYLGYLGIEFNDELNTGLRGKEVELSQPGSKVKVFVIPTNEELAIARETVALV